MLEYLTSDSAFSEVLMEEPAPRAFVLVEGPDEDAILFDHLESGVVRIIAGNKKQVLGAAQLALDKDFVNVFGLVDRDLDALRGLNDYPANVVATDRYDLVADLLAVIGDDPLRRVLVAHAVNSVRRVEAVTARHIVEVIYDLTGPLAASRLASLSLHYPLVFKNYDFQHVVTDNFEAASLPAFVNNAVCKQPDFVIDSDVIEAVVCRIPMVSARHHSGGHDLVGASVAVLARGGTQVSKKAIAANIISLATRNLLASLSCLQDLNRMARMAIGTDVIDLSTA